MARALATTPLQLTMAVSVRVDLRHMSLINSLT